MLGKLAALVCITSAICFVVFTHEFDRANAGPTFPAGNGDVDGSGSINVADAVYLLAYIFDGGPAPAIMPSAVPATGQASCFDQTGSDIPCDGTGQDGEYQLGCRNLEPQIVMGDDVVVDHCTGLMWVRFPVVGGLTWLEALDYSEGLNFAGFDDWRLPNVHELTSIIDYELESPALDPVVWPGAGSAQMWTSTTGRLAGTSDQQAWVVVIASGQTTLSEKTLARPSRACRSIN